MSAMVFDDIGYGVKQDARRIPWNELVALGIRTTADGPMADDVFWQFLRADGMVEVAGSAALDIDSLARQLPAFDARKVIRAMGSCDNRIFRVWHRDAPAIAERRDEAALAERFASLVARIGANGQDDVRSRFAHLYAAWSEPARRYHDLEHLAECLVEIDRERPSAARDRVELALWYHDAVYQPGAHDSEERSAAWLIEDAAALGIPADVAASTAALVRVTRHCANEDPSEDAALIADIDLAILGRDPLRFMEFEFGVGEEYSAIPTVAFLRARGRFLADLIARPIFRTQRFRERFENRARSNVRALLESRRYRTYRWLRWL